MDRDRQDLIAGGSVQPSQKRMKRALDNKPEAENTPKEHETSTDLIEKTDGNASSGSSTLPVPPPAQLTRWTISDISDDFPPLPAVLDPIIEKTAFTHVAMAKPPVDQSYERLEWIGDAYLQLISSSFIYETFPTLEPGKCSLLREIVVRNTTLAEYARHYNFDKRALLPAEYSPEGREKGTKVTNKERTKVLGDIFEAYVAAIIVSDPRDGLARAVPWLKALWAKTLQRDIKDQDETAARVSAGNTNPKVTLAQTIQVPGVLLRYEEIKNGKQKHDRDHQKLKLFTVGVFLDGWGEHNKQLGFGSALSLKEAGAKAARVALENKKLMKLYVVKKQAFLASKRAQHSEGGEEAEEGEVE